MPNVLKSFDFVASTEEEEEDDIHICGHCKREFRKVQEFIRHKKTKECRKHSSLNQFGQSSTSQFNLDVDPEMGVGHFLLTDSNILEALQQQQQQEQLGIWRVMRLIKIEVTEILCLDSGPPGGEWQREAEEAEVISLLANQLSAQQKPVVTGLSSDRNPVVSSSSGDNPSQQLILTSMSPPKTNIFFNVKKGRLTI